MLRRNGVRIGARLDPHPDAGCVSCDKELCAIVYGAKFGAD